MDFLSKYPTISDQVDKAELNRTLLLTEESLKIHGDLVEFGYVSARRRCFCSDCFARGATI
jgi:hypothetical protein